MSIPPLVCSTPPPPDQCEDDNEQEDFDIPYHLSQEDEDDSYDYGNFTFHPHSVSSESKKDSGLCNIETLAVSEAKESTRTEGVEIPIKIEHNHIGTNTNIKNIAKPEEDPNIEDLDLKINEEPLHFTTKEVTINQISEDYNLESSDYTNTVSDAETSPNHESSPSKDRTEDDVSSDSQKDISVSEERIIDDQTLHDEEGLNVINPAIEEYHNAVDTMVTDEKPEKHPELTEDDDFGDFEDFQFVNSQNRTLNTIESCDNPWVNNDSEGGDFGNFTANFDATEVQKVSTVADEATITSQQNNETIDLNKNKTFHDDDDDDDDFGDFDDFKSSCVENTSGNETEVEDLSRTVPVLHFQMSDNEMHVVESLNKVLSSIFEEEISQPAAEFEGKLESVLSVTWGHLKETDVRQPYILNWNNSLGQKSLLKALCIDSRNILFGPKWGYNPPKYAANMGMAPLQPKKPLTPSNSGQNENAAAEKTSKPSNWVDSFTNDGQESCSTENQGVVEVKPSDIDVFEAAISSKTDKIYSSTLNVQPLRQISLPDTHIFTPTDSETPRSKTIHYDNGPPILLPQPVLEITNKHENSTQVNQNNDNKDDDDYWEFQDFRSRAEPSVTMPSSQKEEEPVDQKSENTVFKPNITYQTQVLQPVKMEPIIPTLNWPDPGEVKETFENFSDFVSNTSWGHDKINSQINSPSVENTTNIETGVSDQINDKHKGEISIQEPTIQNVPENDDEFDTFQSALPPKNTVVELSINANFNTNTFTNIPKKTTNQNFPQIANFDYAFPKVSTSKSDVISLENSIPNETLHSLSYISNTTEISSAKPSTPSGSQIPSILQPTLAPTNTTFTLQQNTGQILQPLSLESYSQINWPSPGIDLQDLSRFNPVETLQSLKTDLSVSGTSKTSSPVHMQKPVVSNQIADDDIWGEFVSSRPKQQPVPKKASMFADDDEWTDFVSSPTVKPINGLNTISLNVHTNSNIQKSNSNKFTAKGSHLPLDIPTLNYITPKTSGHNTYNNRHFENL